MAIVPRGQTVVPGGPARPYSSPDSPQDPGTTIGRSLAGLGAELGETHQILADHAYVMQGLQNKSDADNAYVSFVNEGNTLRTKFVENEKGGNALPNLPKYQDDMEKLRVKLGENLNPAAQRLYSADTRRMLAGFESEMSRHAAQQNRVYTEQSSEARMDTAVNLAVQNAGNPMFEAAARETIMKESGFLAEYKGLGSDVAKNVLDQRMSKMISGVITQLANDDPPAANAYFEDHKKEMIGSDVVQVDSFLKRAMQPYLATQIADSVANGRAGAAPLAAVTSNPKGFFSQIAGGEVTITSGPRSEADQERLRRQGYTPAKNSYHKPENGVAFDLTPAKGQSLQDLLKKLKGANLGATELSIHNGTHVHVAWSKQAVQGKAMPSLLAANTPEELASRYEQAQKEVDAQVDKFYKGDPTIKAAAETRLAGIYGRRMTALNATATASRDRIMSAMVDDPAAAPKDLDALFGSYSGAKADYLAMTPTQQKAVQRQLKANANPETRGLSPEQQQTWAYLDGEWRTDPSAFANRNLLNDPETSKLPFTTLKAFISKQNEIKAGKGLEPSEQKMLGWAAPFLAEAEIEKTDPEYNKFMSALMSNAKAYYDINKKYPDQKWTMEQTQSLLIERSSGILSKKYGFEDPAQAGLVPGVPNAFTQAIIAQARERGLALTNAQIIQLYNRKVASGGR